MLRNLPLTFDCMYCKGKTSQNFVAVSECMNFTICKASLILKYELKCETLPFHMSNGKKNMTHCALCSRARAHFTTYTGWKVSLVSAKIEKVESRSIKFVLKNFRLDKIMGNWLIILLIWTIWQILLSSSRNHRKRKPDKTEILKNLLTVFFVKSHRDYASGSTSIVWLIGCISSKHHGQVRIRAPWHQRG